MKKLILFIVFFECYFGCSQILSFAEIGSDPAFCRQFGYQSGNGVVYASATGGTAPYTYQWVNLSNLSSNNNSVWGGLNPGSYEITITDAVLDVIIDTVVLDSINPSASFDIPSPDFNPIPGGWVGTGSYPVAHFVNTSTGFDNPINPNVDTTFYWTWDYPNEPWFVVDSYYAPLYKGYSSGTYSPCLVAFNMNGCVDTTCATLIVFGPLTTGEYTGKGLFFINPISDQQYLKYKLGGLEIGLLRIFNLEGKLIKEIELESEDGVINFNQKHGMYLYELFDPINDKPILSGNFIF